MNTAKERPEKILLTVEEAAIACGYSRAFLYARINAGDIPVVRIGRTTRIPKVWLENWVAKRVSDWEQARQSG